MKKMTPAGSLHKQAITGNFPVKKNAVDRVKKNNTSRKVTKRG
jgi:hypothetical protein